MVWRGIAEDAKQKLSEAVAGIKAARADVILFDLQYAPLVVANGKYVRMESMINEVRCVHSWRGSGSGLPAFPEVGFNGSLPSIWDGTAQSMVFSMPQIRYIQAARQGLKAAQAALERCAREGYRICYHMLRQAVADIEYQEDSSCEATDMFLAISLFIVLSAWADTALRPSGRPMPAKYSTATTLRQIWREGPHRAMSRYKARRLAREILANCRRR